MPNSELLETHFRKMPEWQGKDGGRDISKLESVFKTPYLYTGTV